MVSKWHGSFDDSLDEGVHNGELNLQDNESNLRSGHNFAHRLSKVSGRVQHSKSVDLAVNVQQTPNKRKNDNFVPAIVIGDGASQSKIMLHMNSFELKLRNENSDHENCNRKPRKAHSNPLLNQLKSLRSSFHGLLPSSKTDSSTSKTLSSRNFAGVFGKSIKPERLLKLRAKSADYLKKRELECDQCEFRRKSDGSAFANRKPNKFKLHETSSYGNCVELSPNECTCQRCLGVIES